MNLINCFFQKILKSEILFLAIFLIKLWYAVELINRFNPYSKLYYFFDTDKEFLDYIDRYHNQSILALEEIKKWKSENYQAAELQNYNDPLFDNYNLVKENELKENILCVGIMSKQRPVTSHNYPLKTIVSLITRLPLKYQDRILITVYNVDQVPLKNRTDLSPLIGIVKIVDLKQNVSKLVDNFEGFKKVKEAADYVTALRHYYDQNLCNLILLIEDDSIPCKNWYEKIIESVNSIRKTNWFCLKLFTSFRGFDWAIYPYSVIFAIFKFNELSVRPVGYGVKEYSLGFNAIANLYPRVKLNELADFIEADVLNFVTQKSSEFEPKDIALELFRKLHKYKEFIVEPSIFQHTGLQSSLGGPITYKNIKYDQYRPFQSYSYIKEYREDIVFDPNFWLNK